MSRIDPDKDFAGFVDERLAAAYEHGSKGASATIRAWGSVEYASPDDIPVIEDLARHFDRAAAEIRAISKAIRRKHGITADDEIRRERDAVEERRAER